MKKVDIAIVGAGHLGHRAASHLKNKSVALIALPQSPETLLYRHHAAMILKAADPIIPSLDHPSLEKLSGPCRFINKTTLLVNDERLEAKKFILIPGGVYVRPNVPGLSDVLAKFPVDIDLTTAAPKSIIIIGGGPSGVVFAQKLAAKGTAVTLLCDANGILGNEDGDVSAEITRLMLDAGVVIHSNTTLQQFKSANGKTTVVFTKDGAPHEMAADDLLLATGISPNTQGFDFEKTGVYIGKKKEIVVTEEMRTAASHIWACGMATGGAHHVNLETHQADLAGQNSIALYINKIRMMDEPLPKVIETIPAIARLGLTEKEARAKHNDIHVVKAMVKENAKAQILGETTGFLKLVGRRRGNQLLGVHSVGPRAEEMIVTFDLMMRAGISLSEVTERHHFVGLTFGDLILQAIEKWNET